MTLEELKTIEVGLVLPDHQVVDYDFYEVVRADDAALAIVRREIEKEQSA